MTIVSQKIAQYEHDLAEFLTSWNRAETAFRGLLVDLCGKTAGAYILAAGLGTRSIKEAVLSFAADAMDAEMTSATKHVIEFFDRVLAYRNYYIHGIHLIAFDNTTQESFSEIQAISSKSRFAVHEERVPSTAIKMARINCICLEMALQRLRQCCDPTGHGLTEQQADISVFREQYPLPEPLSKPRRYLLENLWQSSSPKEG